MKLLNFNQLFSFDEFEKKKRKKFNLLYLLLCNSCNINQYINAFNI